jgi:Protein of unknown function (DUF4232)
MAQTATSSTAQAVEKESFVSSPVQSLGLRRRSLALAGAAALAAASAAVALATAAAGAAVAHRGVMASNPSCATAQLSVKFVNQPNGAAGTIYYPIRFTNKGTHACTLRGYPGVSAVTSAGTQIGKSASRSGTGVKTVTIAPKKTASTMVGFVHTANFPASTCKPVTARGLRIIPPNQTTSVTIKRKFSACSGTSVNFLVVLPIK